MKHSSVPWSQWFYEQVKPLFFLIALPGEGESLAVSLAVDDPFWGCTPQWCGKVDNSPVGVARLP